jgi:hypothetical protein
MSVRRALLMNLRDYFENIEGTGILATADSDGMVDLAIYARPHFFEKDTIGFVMLGRLSHKNLQSNSHAAYMFIEKGKGYQGKRLYLRKLREEKNSKIIDDIRRRPATADIDSAGEDRYLVYFRVEGVRPAVGDQP